MEIKLEDDIVIISEIHEEGGYIIRVYPDGMVYLWEVPQYGGEERFTREFTNLHDAITEGKSWT